MLIVVSPQLGQAAATRTYLRNILPKKRATSIPQDAPPRPFSSWGIPTMLTSKRRIHRIYLALTFSLALSLLLHSNANAANKEETETYESGGPKATYAVNKDGDRDGPFKEFYEDGTVKVTGTYKKGKLSGSRKEFHPNGKLKLRSTYKKGKLSGKYSEHDEEGIATLTAQYREGKLSGTLKRLDGRTVLAEEGWANGELILPKTLSLLKKQFKAISKAKIETVGDIPETTEDIVAKVNDPDMQAQRETAVRRLMMYRAACNLPFADIALDRTHSAHSEAGAKMLGVRKMGIDHEPPNPGWSDTEYQFALEGTRKSNLQHAALAAPVADSVRDFMWDTDPINVERLGHRRWCLNPVMGKTGFGRAIHDEHSAVVTMWAFDNSREEVPDYEYFAFPARGLQPAALMRKGKPYAWNCSFNPKKYRMPAAGDLRVKLVPARFDAKRMRITRGKKEIELEHVHVSIEQWSYPPAVIFQPKEIELTAGHSYWVEIKGVKHTDGSDAKIGYLVSFVNLR